ncbi:hypothetical protein [Dyella tabacisoli]|uniref:Uncharacterized protein n=1 Tax=Dyella tabacisoli TaxID=2282381 RepID=A0A369UR91_9GAMM|nr:hypothetical protein [Dyella tabacisoli]RDD80829.1 hypothetical protein DVJ77_15350 [Dyella tabacisoli]
MNDSSPPALKATDRSSAFEGFLAAVGALLVPLLFYPMLLDLLHVPLEGPRSTLDEIILWFRLPLAIAAPVLIGFVFRKYGRLRGLYGFIATLIVIACLALFFWFINANYQA